MRIYVAGPITPRDCTPREASRIHAKNVDRGIKVTIGLIERGHQVFCPHLSYYVHIHPSNTGKIEYGYWTALDDSILRLWAEGLYLIGHSPGADKELLLAHKLKLKIFYSMAYVPDISEMKQDEM